MRVAVYADGQRFLQFDVRRFGIGDNSKVPCSALNALPGSLATVSLRAVSMDCFDRSGSRGT